MKHFVILIAALCLCWMAGCFRPSNGNAVGAIGKLELVSALPLDIPKALEPSGLVEQGGFLYTVADKDNQTIYRVERTQNSARLVPAIQFETPRQYGYMDWEGISVDDEGTFFLISEKLGRLYRVDPDGTASWASPDLREKASQIGLFSKNNAGFEGVTYLGRGRWLGAVEREPRGLVEFSLQEGAESVRPSLQEYSPFDSALPLLRIPDYSGLDTDNGKIYALYRNAHLVVRLERSDDGYQEIEAWSYKHIETDPAHAFRSQTYGQAEGLVVDGDNVYLIFDNNLGGRQSDPNDGRPLFVHAKFPSGKLSLKDFVNRFVS